MYRLHNLPAVEFISNNCVGSFEDDATRDAQTACSAMSSSSQ